MMHFIFIAEPTAVVDALVHVTEIVKEIEVKNDPEVIDHAAEIGNTVSAAVNGNDIMMIDIESVVNENAVSVNAQTVSVNVNMPLAVLDEVVIDGSSHLLWLFVVVSKCYLDSQDFDDKYIITSSK